VSPIAGRVGRFGTSGTDPGPLAEAIRGEAIRAEAIRVVHREPTSEKMS